MPRLTNLDIWRHVDHVKASSKLVSGCHMNNILNIGLDQLKSFVSMSKCIVSVTRVTSLMLPGSVNCGS